MLSLVLIHWADFLNHYVHYSQVQKNVSGNTIFDHFAPVDLDLNEEVSVFD